MPHGVYVCGWGWEREGGRQQIKEKLIEISLDSTSGEIEEVLILKSFPLQIYLTTHLVGGVVT
jgi:hypothetical protein